MSSGATREQLFALIYSRKGGDRRKLFGATGVGVDDVLDERVAHHILSVKVEELQAVDALEEACGFFEAGLFGLR